MIYFKVNFLKIRNSNAKSIHLGVMASKIQSPENQDRNGSSEDPAARMKQGNL